MPFRKAENGGLYGTIGVLLTRMVGDESEEHFGHQSPWGGIQVEIDTYHAPTGRRRTGWTSTEYVEKPQEWWEAQGWTVTQPPLLEEARRLSRARVAGGRS